MHARYLQILPLCDFLMPFWHFEANVITIDDNQPSVGEQIFIYSLEGPDNKVALFPQLANDFVNVLLLSWLGSTAKAEWPNFLCFVA